MRTLQGGLKAERAAEILVDAVRVHTKRGIAIAAAVAAQHVALLSCRPAIGSAVLHCGAGRGVHRQATKWQSDRQFESESRDHVCCVRASHRCGVLVLCSCVQVVSAKCNGLS